MSTQIYRNGRLREQWNDVTRTYTAWDAAGVQTSTRAYTTAENAAADAIAADAASAANESTVRTNLLQDLVDVQTIIDATNATINAGPAPYLKILARAARRLIRAALKKYDGAS